MHCLWLYLQKFLYMQVSQYTLYHCIKGLLIWYTFSCCLRSNEKVNDGWKLLDICFCFAGLILDDCLELSCLLLVFHKCYSKNNEIHKNPYCMNVNYDCWLIRPSNNRSTDILGHVCFSRGRLALHVEQYLI